MDHLENLKKQAKQMARWHRERYYPVAQRIRSGLPQFEGMDDGAILSHRFTLRDAQELIARELGFAGWQLLRKADPGSIPRMDEQRGSPELLGAHPQLFVSGVAATCRFFVEKLGFTVCFQYGKPAFYALVQRDGAYLNLRFVHAPVLNRAAEPDLLSASIHVRNVKELYAEYQITGAPMAQRLRKQPWGTRDFIVRDPDSNLVHFSE